MQQMSAELILQSADQRIDGLGIEILQRLYCRHRLVKAQKPLDQVVQNTQPEKRRPPIMSRHSPDVLEPCVYGVSRIYGKGDPSAAEVLDAYDVEKNTGLSRRNVLDHSRPSTAYS